MSERIRLCLNKQIVIFLLDKLIATFLRFIRFIAVTGVSMKAPNQLESKLKQNPSNLLGMVKLASLTSLVFV